MMSFNPELQRNVWLQMSWARLFVAPILIGILLAGILSTIKLDPEAVAEAARWGFVLLLALWSTRRVADSLAEEISGLRGIMERVERQVDLLFRGHMKD